LICEKRAQQMTHDLPREFWKFKEWEGYYKYQIKLANKLVKKFPAQAIIDTLLSPRTKSVFSLAHPLLKDIIPDFIKKKDDQIDSRKIPDSTKNKQKTKRKKNIVSKLKDIDNGI
jgi:hypothetical protein